MDCKKCPKMTKKNSQIRTLKREVLYHIMCRTGDIEYSETGKKLQKEFGKDYSYPL